jgi:hypothetical protein
LKPFSCSCGNCPRNFKSKYAKKKHEGKRHNDISKSDISERDISKRDISKSDIIKGDISKSDISTDNTCVNVPKSLHSSLKDDDLSNDVSLENKRVGKREKGVDFNKHFTSRFFAIQIKSDTHWGPGWGSGPQGVLGLLGHVKS